MSNCQSHQDLNIEHKTKHRKVLLWGNTLVSVIINEDFSFKLWELVYFFEPSLMKILASSSGNSSPFLKHLAYLKSYFRGLNLVQNFIAVVDRKLNFLCTKCQILRYQSFK